MVLHFFLTRDDVKVLEGEINDKAKGLEWATCRFWYSRQGRIVRVQIWESTTDRFYDVDLARFLAEASPLRLKIDERIAEILTRTSDLRPDEMQEFKLWRDRDL